MAVSFFKYYCYTCTRSCLCPGLTLANRDICGSMRKHIEQCMRCYYILGCFQAHTRDSNPWHARVLVLLEPLSHQSTSDLVVPTKLAHKRARSRVHVRDYITLADRGICWFTRKRISRTVHALLLHPGLFPGARSGTGLCSCPGLTLCQPRQLWLDPRKSI